MFVIRRTWEELEGECVNVETVDVSEYRGRGRARYLTRRRGDPTTGDPNVYWQVLPGSERWQDKDGDVIYSDYTFEIDGQTGYAEPVETTSYLPSVAQTDLDAGKASYYHSDHLGTLRAVSTTQGEPVKLLVHTAFGEPICGASGTPACIPGVPPADTRYQYAGAWQYQTADDDALSALGWLHVGHRYYDPSIGRFLERDPIGIRGAFNVYAYAGSSPTQELDPRGLDRWIVGGTGHTDHQTLIFGARARGLAAVDFASAGWTTNATCCSGLQAVFLDDGEVKLTFPRSVGQFVQVHIPSTPEQDKALIKWVVHQLLNPPGYSGLFYNCQHFARKGARIGLPNPERSQPRPRFPFCFVGDTTVWIDGRRLPIRDAAIGDCASCKNSITGDECLCEVRAVDSALAHRIVMIDLENETVSCTPEHPFKVKDPGWTSAGYLEIGDVLLSLACLKKLDEILR